MANLTRSISQADIQLFDSIAKAGITDVGGFAEIPFREVSGVTDTLLLGDAGNGVETTNGSAVTITIPPLASVAWRLNNVIEICQIGAGQITIEAGAGVTLRSEGNKVASAAQYATIGLRMRANDEWVLSGSLA